MGIIFDLEQPCPDRNSFRSFVVTESALQKKDSDCRSGGQFMLSQRQKDFRMPEILLWQGDSFGRNSMLKSRCKL